MNQFADATGDHQWIHVDVERAKAGPFGGPIAHGYLTLSLGPALSPQIFGSRPGIAMGVNYGVQQGALPRRRCRSASKLRLGAKLLGVDDVAGGVQVTMEFVVRGRGRAPSRRAWPRCIFRYYV